MVVGSVYVRVRPATEDDEPRGRVFMEHEQQTLRLLPEGSDEPDDALSFTFDHIFGEETTQREVFERDGILLAVSEYTQPGPGESAAVEWVRYRTVGDLTITGAVRSKAVDIAATEARSSNRWGNTSTSVPPS